MKNIDLKLVSELMKNSRRSDRELAKVLGISQPTVTRTRTRLEKEGYIREYTIIPDFRKLGFEIMSVSLNQMNPRVTPDMMERARSKVRENESKDRSPILMVMTGMGPKADRVLFSLSEDFSAYSDFSDSVKQYPLVDVRNTNSFLINLNEEAHFMPFTFSGLARYLEEKQKRQKPKRVRARETSPR